MAVFDRSGRAEKKDTIKKGLTIMGEGGKRDKGKRETQKQPKLSLKEKRKLKNEKKNKA